MSPRARLKHRWSLSHNYLTGITWGVWRRLLRDNRFAVDPPYWHRAAVVTVASAMNAVWARREQRRYGAAIERVRITEPPLFILGHWRTGTTLLHNLLAQDTERLAYANTYQVVNPHTFLSTEATFSRWFSGLVPPKRPMDNMPLSFQTPQEDEFAPCLMSLRSLYVGITFPRREAYYGRYLTFREVPRHEVDEWQAALLWFLKKLTLKHGRRLVLKSPPHTARIRYLLEMFPEARFVHIHRDPYAVFQSTRHYFDTATWHTFLQRPDVTGFDESILRRYVELYDAFFEDRGRIPAGRLHEMAFEDLERDPIAEVATLYQRLGLPDFDRFRPALERYAASLAGYEKNRFPPLSPDWRRRVAECWGRSFHAWGYGT